MSKKYNEMKFTKEQLGIPNDGLLHLHDLTYDFEDYFDRHGTDAMSEDEAKEFSLRVLGLFCKDFWESGGNPAAIQPWVANYLAKVFFQICGGVPMREALPTVFEPSPDWLTPKGLRAFEIYAFCKSNSSDQSTLSSRLKKCAETHCLSYEAVRGDYYAMKAVIVDKKPWPKGFLKK